MKTGIDREGPPAVVCGDPHFLEALRGRVAWIDQVNPAHARKLRRLLEVCEREAVTGGGG